MRWQRFLRDSGGTGFWHEAYFLRGGIDTMYDDMSTPTGLGAIAPTRAMRGPLFGARGRARDNADGAGVRNDGLDGEATVAPVVDETAYYATGGGKSGHRETGSDPETSGSEHRD